MEIKTDLSSLMICRNCKHFDGNSCALNHYHLVGVKDRAPVNADNSCKDWEEKIEDPKVKEVKEVYRLMYQEIVNQFKNYIVTEEDNYKFISLWTLGTYAHQYFNTYPLLFFNAMRGSGKTRTLKLISAIGANGDGSIENNLTEACLFRIPPGRTTCIDEVEQIGNKEKATLRELLNAAYKKGMKVRRMKKTKKKNKETGAFEEIHEAEEFEPYFPIAMANINGIEEVLADRAITLILEKSGDPEKTRKAEDFLESNKIKWIKMTLNSLVTFSDVIAVKKHQEKWNFWLNSHYNTTNTTHNTNITNTTNVTNPTIKRYLEMTKTEKIDISNEEEVLFNKLNESGIVGRNFELFMPLLILAKFLGDDIFEDIFAIAKKMVNEKKSDEYSESRDVSLYQYVLSKEDEFSNHFLRVKNITDGFKLFIGAGKDDEDINDKWMGRALKRLNLIIDKRKMNTGREVTLNYNKAKEKLKIFI